MAKNKTLKVLSTGTVAGMIAAAVLSSQAFAAVDAYSVKIGDDVLKYDKAALTESFLASKAGEAAPLYEDFTAKLTEAKGFYAFSDAKTGKFVSYDDIQAKFLEAKAAGEAFVVDAYTESVDAKVIEVPTVKKVVVKDGKIVVETEGQVTGELKVTSVSAINTKEFKVVFNRAVEDTSKISVAVKQSTNPVAVSVTWNTAKTEAILTKSSNFGIGSYTVNVKNDATDLGTSDVAIAEQKIAKIEITASKLGVSTVNSIQTGYATYKIFDQYGADITNSALANNVQFQSGVGTATGSKGLITLQPSNNINLLTFTSGIVITATDSTNGVSTSANLTVTSQVGTLSDITLSGLTNVDGKVLTAGDVTTVFYADYTALDISGNSTRNYDLLKQGLILNANDELTTSSPYVTAKLVQDPTDSKKGLIEVRANSTAITVDMPLVITAMTKTGKTSQINTTLKKQAEVATFTLLSPSDSIASGESKVIPFIALDQDGKEITKYSELKGYVTLTGADFVKNLDGTASVKNDKVYNNGQNPVPVVISAVTPTGKYSSITINIQKPVSAEELSLNTSILKSIMQAPAGGALGAKQTIDFGWDNGGLAVKDQYGREIDMVTNDGSNYKVVAYSNATSVVNVTPSKNTATVGNTAIEIEATGVGSATVRFDLVKIDTNTVIDSKSQTFTVLADKDIKDYTIDTVANPIYIINSDASQLGMTVSDQEDEYKANPKVYGTTSTGAKVVLRGTPVISATSTSGDFTVYSGANGGGYKDVKVIANKLADPAKTGSSTTLTVTLLGADGAVHTVTTPITSSTAKPAAVSVDAKVATEVAGISRDGDTITLAPTGSDTFASLLGNTLAKYQANGTKGTKNIYFAPVDQYGKEGSTLSRIVVVPAETNLQAGSTLAIANNGAITGTAQPGDYVTVSGVTTNGLVKTIKINFGATVDTSNLVNAANTAITNATTAKTNYIAAGGLNTALVYTAVDTAITALQANLAGARDNLATLTSNLNTATTTLNNATAVIAPLAAVNNAVDGAAMKLALENAALGLDLTAYNTLSNADKLADATEIWSALVAPGFADKAAVQTALNGATKTAAAAAAAADVAVKALYNEVGMTTLKTTTVQSDIDAAVILVNRMAAGAPKTALLAKTTAATNLLVEKAKAVAVTVANTVAVSDTINVAPTVAAGFTASVTAVDQGAANVYLTLTGSTVTLKAQNATAADVTTTATVTVSNGTESVAVTVNVTIAKQ